MLSSVNVDSMDDVDPPHSKEKLTYHLLSAGGKKNSLSSDRL